MATVLSVHDRRILTAVNSGASSLSFVGSGFIVLCYSLFKELRKFSFKLVFYLSLSDMLCSFFNMVGDPSKGFFCYAQGYITHFFCVASFLWTTTIAFTLHRTVVRHKTDVEDLEAMFHLYVWGTSLVMTVIRSIGNDHTHLGAWCWAQTGRTGKAIHFITFYVPLWGAILYNGFTYFQVIRMLNNATRMAFGMSDHAYQFDSRTDTKGLFNSIAYGLNASVRRAIYERLELFWPERLQRWFPNSSRYRNQQQQQSELISLKIQDQQ
ncbi:G-protein coupled receptor 1-like isoform X6 [Durio zibethinus]|uniref:G-protein coupled receptor 1-like isoform X6 n=1 Tax=Durio zibethinus TaxID=66656 RepID=A0A6P6A7M8_DURZI|nr:G-protein coupled receptor 1-like isoform X6 [Durio zibethinus]